VTSLRKGDKQGINQKNF